MIKHGPGKLIQLPDGRKVVQQNKQPLLKSHGKVVLHLLNEDLSLQEKDGQSVTLLKTIEEYNEMIPRCKAIGMVD